MYVPASFRVTDRGELLDFMETYSFATLLSGALPAASVTHLPLLLDRSTPGGETLLGHMARANPHTHALQAGTASLAIFHGPHAYVSPAWYVHGPPIPTWNYAVVHVHGTPRILPDGRTRDLLLRQVEAYEGPWHARRDDGRDGQRDGQRDNWRGVQRDDRRDDGRDDQRDDQRDSRRDDRRDDRYEAMLDEELQFIVGFELPLERIEAKFKLGQNRKPEDQAGAIDGLARDPRPGSRELAEFTRRRLRERPPAAGRDAPAQPPAGEEPDGAR